MRIISTIILGLAIFCSCTDSSVVGSDLIPAEDNIILTSTDTFTVNTELGTYDSIISFEESARLTNNTVLGYINDPTFGSTEANLYIQFSPASYNIAADDFTLDSTVLYLTTNNLVRYGDTTSAFSFEINEISNAVDLTSDYYTKSTFNIDATTVASHTQVPNFQDSLVLNESNTYPGFRVKLSDAFGNKIFSTTNLVSEADFNAAHFGLKIASQSTNQQLLGVNSGLSRIVCFYTDDNNEAQSFEYTINSSSFVNPQYIHNASTGTVNNYINDSDLDDLIFIQGNDGIKTKVSFPTIHQLTDKYVINKAELQLEVQNISDEITYPLVSQLITTFYDADNNLDITADAQIGNIQSDISSFLEGELDNYSYNVNITKQLKDIISGEVSNEIFLDTYLNLSYPNRVVLNGTSAATNPLKLKLTLTEK